MSGSQSHGAKRRNMTKKFKDRSKLIKTMKDNKRLSYEDFPRLAKRRINCKRSILSLPNELITDVLAGVAASSFYDFFDVKFSCKVFHQIADDNYILQHVSLDKFPIIPWSPSTKQKQALFLEKCKKSGHPEVLYRKGVVNYFSFSKVEEGVSCLRRAAKVGHLGASYVLGVVLLCAEQTDQQQEGRRLLSHVRSEKGIKESQRKLKDITSIIWLNNFLKPKSNSCPMQDQHRIKQGWPSDEEEDVNCEICGCNLEVTFVCNLLRGIMTY